MSILDTVPPREYPSRKVHHYDLSPDGPKWDKFHRQSPSTIRVPTGQPVDGPSTISWDQILKQVDSKQNSGIRLGRVVDVRAADHRQDPDEIVEEPSAEASPPETAEQAPIEGAPPATVESPAVEVDPAETLKAPPAELDPLEAVESPPAEADPPKAVESPPAEADHPATVEEPSAEADSPEAAESPAADADPAKEESE
jgi:hypothetical protein